MSGSLAAQTRTWPLLDEVKAFVQADGWRKRCREVERRIAEETGALTWENAGGHSRCIEPAMPWVQAWGQDGSVFDRALVKAYISDVTAKAGLEDHLRVAGRCEDDDKSAVALEPETPLRRGFPFYARFLYGPRGPGFGAAASTSSAISSMLQRRSVTPAAMAGLTRRLLWMRQKLYQTVYSATMCIWLSSFFEKALVSRVKRRIAILIVRWCRSA